jgi:hypothetical protein
MRSLKYLVACFIILFTAKIYAQTPLAQAELSLTDTLSATALGKTARELPEMLINAFKQGKLKAYRFAFRKQPVYGELKQWPNPKEWNPSVRYDKNDSVLYKGKLYRYVFRRNEPGVIQLGGLTPDIAPDAHGINDYWKEYKRLPPVIGMNYTLPTERDLLKVEKWEEVKSRASPPMPEWQVKNEYYAADMVSYKGKTYQATRNNVKSIPTNQNDWQVTYHGISDDAFTYLQFVYNSETRLPIAFQLSLGSDGEICIGFYLEAVQKYLIEIKQGMLANKLDGLLRETAY